MCLSFTEFSLEAYKELIILYRNKSAVMLLINFISFGYAILSLLSSVTGRSSYDNKYVANFLSGSGYLHKRGLNEDKIEDLENALREFYKLNVTERINNEAMTTRRCGVKDQQSSSEVNQYVLANGGRWEHLALTYSIKSFPHNLNKDDVRKEIKDAFNIWTKYTPLTFQEKYFARTELKINFFSKNHGDSYNFDGPGRIAGHAFQVFTENRGDIHLDLDEMWEINSSIDSPGVNLYQVAAHEIGHVLGINHSMKNKSIMYADYHYNERFRKDLDTDSILAIQKLYSRKKEKDSKEKDMKKNMQKHVKKCKETPVQIYQYSPQHKEFSWDSILTNALLKTIDDQVLPTDNSELGKSKENYSIYKKVKYELCKEIIST